jgi:lipoate-protein ligase A
VPAAPLRIIRDGYPDHPGLDTALSRALLIRASAGEVAETFRLNRPGRVVAFGKRDTLAPGYAAAVTAARSRGYEAVERLAGGRAAVFHEGALAFSWSIPDPDPRNGITARFEMLSALMVRSFSRLGIDAEIGEIPGEYCPGAYSVNVGGTIKVMGVGQRLAKAAAHIGGVVVVSGSGELQDILIPVYEALGIPWTAATAGALTDAAPEATPADVTDAILRELATTRELRESAFEPETLSLARELAADHVAR